MVRLEFKGRAVEGMLLQWSQDAVCLLGRDGRMWNPKPNDVTSAQKSVDAFRAMGTSELRTALTGELGHDFEVTSTGHYLVAHPRGQGGLWAQRFEDLYRALIHYFSVRGFQTTEPVFPLIGVVCHDQAEFARFCAADGHSSGGGLAGYYHIATNRIILYDHAKGKAAPSDYDLVKRKVTLREYKDAKAQATARDWRVNGALVIHEATHQTAFNIGVHNRFAQPPRWLGEGLATLFEAPGVYDSQRNLSIVDRVNREKLAELLRNEKAQEQPNLLQELIARDRLFQAAPGTAYAESWGLTFYLTETQPGKYAEYLQRTARRPAFSEYTPSQRLADFSSVFGDDWLMLRAQMLRFLKSPQLSGAK
jgi:hypothetical protein